MSEVRDRWSKIDIVAGVLTPIFIFVFGIWYGSLQHQADQAQKSADRVASLVKDLNSDKPREQLMAIALLRREKEKHPEAVPDELLVSAVPTLVNVAVNDRDPEVSQQAQQLVKEVTKNADPGLVETVKRNLETPSARVYIHIPDEDQRAGARQIETRLENEKFNVPGIEKVAAGPNRSELRFFRRDEEDEANRIVQLLHDREVGDVQAKYVEGSENSNAIRPRHFELWFSKSALANRTP